MNRHPHNPPAAPSAASPAETEAAAAISSIMEAEACKDDTSTTCTIESDKVVVPVMVLPPVVNDNSNNPHPFSAGLGGTAAPFDTASLPPLLPAGAVEAGAVARYKSPSPPVHHLQQQQPEWLARGVGDKQQVTDMGVEEAALAEQSRSPAPPPPPFSSFSSKPLHQPPPLKPARNYRELTERKEGNTSVAAAAQQSSSSASRETTTATSRAAGGEPRMSVPQPPRLQLQPSLALQKQQQQPNPPNLSSPPLPLGTSRGSVSDHYLSSAPETSTRYCAEEEEKESSHSARKKMKIKRAPVTAAASSKRSASSSSRGRGDDGDGATAGDGTSGCNRSKKQDVGHSHEETSGTNSDCSSHWQLEKRLQAIRSHLEKTAVTAPVTKRRAHKEVLRRSLQCLSEDKLKRLGILTGISIKSVGLSFAEASRPQPLPPQREVVDLSSSSFKPSASALSTLDRKRPAAQPKKKMKTVKAARSPKQAVPATQQQDARRKHNFGPPTANHQAQPKQVVARLRQADPTKLVARPKQPESTKDTGLVHAEDELSKASGERASQWNMIAQMKQPAEAEHPPSLLSSWGGLPKDETRRLHIARRASEASKKPKLTIVAGPKHRLLASQKRPARVDAIAHVKPAQTAQPRPHPSQMGRSRPRSSQASKQHEPTKVTGMKKAKLTKASPNRAAQGNAMVQTKRAAKAQHPPSLSPPAEPEALTDLERLQKETRDLHMARRPASSQARSRSFALEYNECSVIAVAKWANMFSGGLTPAERVMKPIPVSEANFRKCSVCGKWGHFEVLCEHLTSDDSLVLQNELQECQFRRKGATEGTELCEGFLIEQRGKPFDSRKRPRTGSRLIATGMEVTQLDVLSLKAAPDAETLTSVCKPGIRTAE